MKEKLNVEMGSWEPVTWEPLTRPEDWTDRGKGVLRSLHPYHHKIAEGRLPNGWYAHGEFGDDRGPYIHYLLIFQIAERAKVLYHLENGEWVRKHRFICDVRKLLKEIGL